MKCLKLLIDKMPAEVKRYISLALWISFIFWGALWMLFYLMENIHLTDMFGWKLVKYIPTFFFIFLAGVVLYTKCWHPKPKKKKRLKL